MYSKYKINSNKNDIPSAVAVAALALAWITLTLAGEGVGDGERAGAGGGDNSDMGNNKWGCTHGGGRTGRLLDSSKAEQDVEIFKWFRRRRLIK